MQDLLANNIESMIDPITTNVQQLRDGSLARARVSPRPRGCRPSRTSRPSPSSASRSSPPRSGSASPRRKGLPAPIVERLTSIVPPMLQRPELMARFSDLQTLPRNPAPMGGDFVAVMREEITAWTAVARQFNIVVS
jgi:tripartite-type tricarboxylate transporter receptor subunit TctC